MTTTHLVPMGQPKRNCECCNISPLVVIVDNDLRFTSNVKEVNCGGDGIKKILAELDAKT